MATRVVAARRARRLLDLTGMSKIMSRRELVGAGAVTLGLVVVGCKRNPENTADTEADVSAGEDLMREHGVLERLMVVYRATADRLESGDRGVATTVHDAATIARDFVEAYHERIEEQYVFPRFVGANQLVELVTVLRQQHDAGRRITSAILELARGTLANDADRSKLAAALRGYVTMFAPHVGREDTVLFPAFHQLVGREYDELGERFEDEETKRFGKGGFERYVAQLPAIEAAAGVADLARFTVTPEQLSPRG
jgi:hemerythrin-like domain-containing protein